VRRQSVQLSETRWLLWVDARGRITPPKDFRNSHDWRDGDILGFDELEDKKRFTIRNLNRDLRQCLADLEGLRGSNSGSPDAARIEELASRVVELTDHLYPIDESGPHTGFAHRAFAQTQTAAKVKREEIRDRVEVILASVETRRVTYELIQKVRGDHEKK
jgi:bifunctional DNA-binding transcriptional regulator/antitoxin component of YhaV-PrlF toxin-antitoxin module